MKKIFRWLYVAVVAITVSGCSSDNVETEERPEVAEKIMIDFTPMTFGKYEASVTRGAQTTKEDITYYGVSAAIYPAADSYTSAACGSYWFCEQIEAATGQSGHYWPGEEYKVAFYAYAPYGNAALTVQSKDDIGYPVYCYTVPTTITEQVDFITAEVTDHSGEGITEPVPLTFSHRLADIRFLVHNKGTSSITVHSVAIDGVKYSGTLTGDTWTLGSSVNSSTVNPFLLTTETTIAGGATTDVTGTANHFIMMPQTVATGTQFIDVDVTVNGERKNLYHTLEADIVLQQGKTYTFTLNIGQDLLVVDEETDITDWEVEVTYLHVAAPTTETMTQPSIDGGTNTDNEDWDRTVETKTITPSSTSTNTMTQPNVGSGENVGADDWEEEE